MRPRSRAIRAAATAARPRQRLRLDDEALGLAERSAEAFDPRELRQDLRAGPVVCLLLEELAKSALSRIEIVEVPELTQAIRHAPTKSCRLDW